jgi:pimeloyl-ACP methyl ester carboxylesterase
METVTSRDGTSIAFARVGSGPPLVVVGGAPQFRAIDPQTAKLAELLAGEFTVYHYDRRGRGDGAGKASYDDVDREIDDLDALIEHAGELAVVFGSSGDAVLALRAAYAGVAIRKLALYEPPFIVAPMREGAFSPAYDDPVMVDNGSGGPTPLEQWSTLNVATLVLDGSESPPHRHIACDLLAATLSRAERRTLARQSHEVRPDVLARVLIEFFNRENGVTAGASDERAVRVST